MDNCLPNWPIYFTLQGIFLLTGLMVWRAIHTRREQVRMPALSVFVGALSIVSLLGMCLADSCLYPEALRASVCAAMASLGYAMGLGIPVLSVLVMREFLVRLAGGSASVESRILKSFCWCVAIGGAVAACAFALSVSPGTPLRERIPEFFRGAEELIMWVLFGLALVMKLHLSLPIPAGLRWIFGSLVAFRLMNRLLWAALHFREDLWNTYGSIPFILLMLGLYLGVRAEPGKPESQVQVTA
jgi:hypothetical protein